MKKILFFLLFLCICRPVIAQDLPKLSILQKQLSASRPDTGRINVLLQLAEFEILKKGEYKTDLDSAADFINRAEQLNSIVRSAEATGHITIERSLLAHERHDDKDGKTLIQQAIKQLSATGNRYLLGKAYQSLADYYNNTQPEELQKKIALIQAAVNFYRSADYPEHAAFCDKNLAEIIPDPDTAFKKLNEAFAIYNAIHYKKLQGVLNLYAQHYAAKNDYKKALEYDLQAVKVEEEQHDRDGTLVEIENNIGNIYSALGDRPNQLRFYEMAASSARAIGDINSAVEITLNLSLSYQITGHPLKGKELMATISAHDLSGVPSSTLTLYYLSKLHDELMLKEFDDAKHASADLAGMLKTAQLADDEKVSVQFALIQYYLKVKQYAEAKRYLLINDEALKKAPTLKNTIRAYDYWFMLDTSMHDHKAAVYHLLLQRKFSDSLYTANRSKEIQELQVRFDTKEKESQITFFRQKAALETQNLRQANIVKDFMFGGTVLLLIIAGLLYRQNLLKQRSSKVISNKNALLQQLLDEKEWLLKEVHHRVKNNLHTVICLLESQAAYLENDALKAIENSQHRIYAMSLIHQKLYQSDDIKTIDMDVYLKEFTRYLDDSFGNPAHIKLLAEIEPIKLGVAQAIPLGLIINEAVTNAYKYAFPGHKKGMIKVSLHRSDNLIQLTVSDNGIGMQIKDSADDAGSLGMELIKGLTTELNGELKLTGTNGTAISILFGVTLFEKVIADEKLTALT